MTVPMEERMVVKGLDGVFGVTDTFARRHIGPREKEIAEMVGVLGYGSLEEFTGAVVPEGIRLKKPMGLGAPKGEREALEELREIARKNLVYKSFIGMGYYGTITPPVILRNILENPGWYTQYTPYQAEISQGRLEALLNFQTMIADLTGLPLANASLLDEGTAAAEAMAMCYHQAGGADGGKGAFFVSEHCHPQTIAVVRTRARALGVECVAGDELHFDFAGKGLCGALVAYPWTDGRIADYRGVVEKIHAAGGLAVVVADLLALTLIAPPGEFGADIAVGSAQRFGVPMGFGGPHAAYMATKPEYVRKMPGRIVGVSKDAEGRPAIRLALQTREQHIRRDKATSNICTAQVLLAIMASMYAVYHGPDGLKAIARRVHGLTRLLAAGVRQLGHTVAHESYFDTLRIRLETQEPAAQKVMEAARKARMNLRQYDAATVGVSLDETTTAEDVRALLNVLGMGRGAEIDLAKLAEAEGDGPAAFEARTSAFLTQKVFNRHHSETEMLRYIKRLEARDLSLAQAMIPLGSCTMKLNATAEMIPVTWPEFAELHPFVPAEQAKGYQKLCADLEKWLSKITGFAAASLQPNAGSQGEYAGLLTIRAYHESRGQGKRNVCLIPTSAHGTNPASAVTAGFTVVPVACDAKGNVDLGDLRAKASEHKEKLAALMLTYPSTHGVFEEGVTEICRVVHEAGGQVYMDGANMNAMVGLCRPADIGADVCHLNLHKTFCIPHGGGGPGVGPIAVAKHLAAFLPGDPLLAPEGAAFGAVSSAAYGSASILPISWMYIAMMGEEGLRKATQVAMLNANYMARKLEGHYPVAFKGRNGLCAHEFIIDAHDFTGSAGVTVEDIAKRLMDYGFHAPTMSWPEPGTLMIEPTESEPKAELDRLVAALMAIREEIREIEAGRGDRKDNPLKNAPHTAAAVTADAWEHKYTRTQAAWPMPGLRENKFWPAVARIDNPWGDRNLVCACEQ